jgi:tetratricopeptide (TPR) repeat protein
LPRKVLATGGTALGIEKPRRSLMFYVPPLIGFIFFLVYLLQIRQQPFFEHLTVNPLIYDNHARLLLKGLPRQQPFFLSPLYPAFISTIYFLTHESRLAVAFVQGVLLAVNIWLIGQITKKIASTGPALVASFITALYWSFYYFSGELLPTALCITFLLTGLLLFVGGQPVGFGRPASVAIGFAGALFFVYAMPFLLNLGSLVSGPVPAMPLRNYVAGLVFFVVFVIGEVALFLLCRYRSSLRRHANTIASGNILGITALVWSGTVVMTGLLALRLLAQDGRRLLKMGVFVLGFSIPVLASLSHNYIISGETIPITASFGANLFLGNNPASDGMNPFIFGESNRVQIEANRLALSGKRRSDLFRNHALAFIREDPGEWLRLVGRKCLLSITNTEIDNNADISERKSAWKHLFVPRIGFGIVFPLSILGILHAVITDRRASILVLGYLGFFAVGIIFFVCERFRLPGMIFLIPLAAIGLECFLKDWRRRNVAGLLTSVLVLLAAAVASNLDLAGISDSEFPSIIENRAYIQRISGNYTEARRLASRALGIEPDHAGAQFQLGALEEGDGNIEMAMTYYLDSLADDPFFFASYTGARRILERNNISVSYLDDYVERAIDEAEINQSKSRIIGFLTRRLH